MYYPEANVLIPIGSTDSVSNCPSFKQTIITVVPASAAAGSVASESPGLRSGEFTAVEPHPRGASAPPSPKA